MKLMTSAMLLALGLVSGACGGGSAPPAQTFVGTWNATRYELVNPSSPTTKVELISQGASATLVLRADNTFQLSFGMAGHGDEAGSGTWSASVDVLTLHQNAPFTSTFQFDYALSGSTLTLTGGGSEWDFDGDGTPEAATLNVTAVKT